MKKNIIIGITIGLIILLICAFVLLKVLKKQDIQTSGVLNQITDRVEDIVQTDIADSDIMEENTVLKNSIQEEESENSNNKEEQKPTPSGKSDVTNVPTQDTTQKAIDIVKKDYEEDEEVNYNCGIPDAQGNYVVEVTDKNTKVLARYWVNVDTGEFTKKEYM